MHAQLHGVSLLKQCWSACISTPQSPRRMRPRLSGKHHAHQHLGCITPAARASTSEGQQQTQQHKYHESIHYAASQGDLDRVMHLVSQGAVVDEYSQQGRTPLHEAAWTNQPEVVEFLLQCHVDPGADELHGEWGGSSPLALAAGRGHLQVARHLISYGADVNAKDDTEETPLHFAAKHGHCDIVGELLAAGAALDAQDISVRCLLLGIAWKGTTPLHEALFQGDESMIHQLIMHGADLHVRDNLGQTPLGLLQQSGLTDSSRDMIQKLLTAKLLDANAQVAGRTTLLHKATAAGQMQMVKLLLSFGADIALCDEQGQTAFDIALRDNNTDIMHLMIEHYYDVQQNLENEDILLQDQAPS